MILYLNRHTSRPSSDAHPDKWEPPVAERKAPHVCRHGFMASKCLAPDCENYDGFERKNGREKR
jgi:hypothetical protein